MMRVVDATAGLSGGMIVLAQAVPVVPEDFKSWPGTAILGLITLAAILAGVWERRMGAKALSELATGVTKLAVELQEANTRANELAAKLGAGNELQIKTLANLEARPCMAEDMAEDLLKSLKKTQRIKVEG